MFNCFFTESIGAKQQNVKLILLLRLINKIVTMKENKNMSNLKKLLGKRIKELRIKKHYTQEYLAELTDLGSTSISKIETGLYHPSDENLEKIAEALEVEPYQLYMYNHFKPVNEIKESLHKIVDNADDDEIRLIYRILSAF